MIIKKYIIGVPGRGNEILAKLEKLGGKSINQDCNRPNCIYFIDENNDIVYLDKDVKWVYNIIIECFEEIVLPPVFVPETFTLTFVTAPKTKDCKGCYFEDKSNCENSGLPFCKGVIYKLKKQ